MNLIRLQGSTIFYFLRGPERIFSVPLRPARDS